MGMPAFRPGFRAICTILRSWRVVAARARGKVLGRPSPKMAGGDRAAMVRKWMKETGGENYAKLGEMLGGVSAATAWRVVKAMPPAMEVVDE